MKELVLDLPEEIDDGTFTNRIAARGIIIRDGRYLTILGKYGDCKFPGGGMEKGETLQETLLREVREETGFHVKKDSIREAFLVHERRKGHQGEAILIMDSHYYFCEAEQEEGERSLSDYESGSNSNSEASWLTLSEMMERNESVKDFSKAPWAVREKLIMNELLKGNGNKAEVWMDEE